VIPRRSAWPPVAGVVVAFAYFLAAPALPALPAGDVTVLVAGGLGLVLVATTTLSLLPLRDGVVSVVLVLVASGLVMGGLDVGGVGAGANVFEALVAAAVGLLFARALNTAAVAVAVPVFVALVDVWSVATGPSSQLLAGGTPASDPLSFDLPAWGSMGSAGHVGLSDAIFLAMFAAWAWAHGLRRAATIAGLVCGLIASLLLGVALKRAIPALPLLAAGYLLPNADLIAPLLRGARARPDAPS
jgi:hypothetical protein